jgi:asparagine synthase (glutamine-hydrolysing)
VQLALQPFQRVSLYKDVAAAARRRRLAENHWFDQEFLLAARPSPPKPDSSLRGALKWSAEHCSLPLYLRVEDRNSMAHSVEARVPFLDHRLATFAWQMPNEWKLRGPWNKYVLREAMRGRIPESVRARVDKMGFPVPSARWLSTSLYEPINDLLASRSTRERGFYRVDLAVEHLARIKRGETRDPGPLFDIAQVELIASRASEYADPQASLTMCKRPHSARAVA